ncbi:MAG TPA: hypothetical protein VF190_01145 [Rhodothermales bacterium]
MTDEEFNRLKEEEKAHLRQMRSLKRAVRLLERQRSVTSALEEMTTRSKAALEANEKLIEEIAFDTARQEAKLDVALESTEVPNPDLLDDLAAARARALVDDVRRETAKPESATPNPSDSPAEKPAAPDKARPDSLPEKTLGRLR